MDFNHKNQQFSGNKMKIIYGLLFSLASCSIASAHNADKKSFSSRPDSHAPIGVMGDHMHKSGEWMLSYRYMNMEMDGLLQGNDNLSDAEYMGETSHMVRPDTMQMQMHMLGFMYAPTDNVTLMLGLPYKNNDMDLQMSNGASSFTTNSSGWGDAKLGGLIRLPALSSTNHNTHANMTFTVPTASTSERDNTPMMKNALLPYAMQTGFDTWQVEGGFTYGGHQQQGNFSWGAQFLYKTSLENNSQGYKAGDQITVNSWLSYLLTEKLSVSVRLNYIDRDEIEGIDERLNPMMISTAVADNYAMKKTSLLLGANYIYTAGALKGHRLALEVGHDIDEKHDGIGMNAGTTFVLGWQKAF